MKLVAKNGRGNYNWLEWFKDCSVSNTTTGSMLCGLLLFGGERETGVVVVFVISYQLASLG